MTASTIDTAGTAPRPAPKVWRPDRTSMAPPAVLGAAALTGLLAAATLHAPGVAYPLVGAAVLGTALVGVRPRPTRTTALGCGAALAVLCVAAIRADEGLVAIAVVVSWIVAMVALLGVTTWTGTALAPTAVWWTPLRLTGWVRRGWTRRRTLGGSARPVRVLGTAVLSVALVALFGSLFAGADPEFARVVDGLVPTLTVDHPGARIFLGVGFAVLTLGVTYLRRRRPHLDRLAPVRPRSIATWEWVVPVAALDLLFAVFVLVTMPTLFGGDGHVRSADGPTYAEYARQGFWQLCAVAALTMLVIAVAVRRIDLDRPRTRLVARVVLGALCLLSLLVVASAMHRMSLYQNAFGFTRLRLGVWTAELWFGVVFTILIAAGIRMRGSWIPRVVLGSAVAVLLALAVVNPDGVIADRNVDRYERTGALDVNYLAGLSADAVPALDRLPEPLRSCALSRMTPTPTGAWYEFNLARHRAQEILKDRPVHLRSC